jgi:hypothetical protein
MSSKKKRASKGHGKSAANSGAAIMKQALAKKRPASGWPEQAKPRDSGVQKVKKNAF